MKIKLLRSTVINGKKHIVKDPEKPPTLTVSDADGRLLIGIKKAVRADKAE